MDLEIEVVVKYKGVAQLDYLDVQADLRHKLFISFTLLCSVIDSCVLLYNMSLAVRKPVF